MYLKAIQTFRTILKPLLEDAMIPLQQEIMALRSNTDDKLNNLQDAVKPLQQEIMALHAKLNNLQDGVHTEFGYLREATVIKRVEEDRGIRYVRAVEPRSLLQLIDVVLDMPAFREHSDIYAKYAALNNASKALMTLVDELLIAALEEGKERFPGAESIIQIITAKQFDQISAELVQVLKSKDLTNYERDTLEAMRIYYSHSKHKDRADMLCKSGLGIQALRFKLAPKSNKKPLETGTSLEFDMQGEIRRFNQATLVEAAEIKSSYSSEAANQVALRARVLAWCVETMKLAQKNELKVLGMVYILRRTEKNKELANGQQKVEIELSDLSIRARYL